MWHAGSNEVHADWYKQHPIRNSQDILIINFIWWYERKSHKVNVYYYTSLYMNVFYWIIYYSQMSLDNNWCIQLQPWNSPRMVDNLLSTLTTHILSQQRCDKVLSPSTTHIFSQHRCDNSIVTLSNLSIFSFFLPMVYRYYIIQQCQKVQNKCQIYYKEQD
jgi:hypothetical protein